MDVHCFLWDEVYASGCLGTDVLVDGRFEEDLKDTALKWRGSSNQQVIDVKKSLEQSKKVLYTKMKTRLDGLPLRDTMCKLDFSVGRGLFLCLI